MYTFLCLGTTTQNRRAHHLFQTAQLEEGFEAITEKARHGWLLDEVCYLDADEGQGNWIELPAGAFDCHPVRPTIERMQADWTGWLSGYPPSDGERFHVVCPKPIRVMGS